MTAVPSPPTPAPTRSFEGWGEEMADFGKLPTYPSPTATLTLSSYLGQNVSFGRGDISDYSKTQYLSML